MAGSAHSTTVGNLTPIHQFFNGLRHSVGWILLPSEHDATGLENQFGNNFLRWGNKRRRKSGI